jgi:hypothetical protein
VSDLSHPGDVSRVDCSPRSPIAEALRISLEPTTDPKMGRFESRDRVLAVILDRHDAPLSHSAIDVLRDQRWSVLEPNGNTEWLTSDHPVVRLNFKSAEEYDFVGGWGSETGCDILMPLSPRHLVWTQVGQRARLHRQRSTSVALVLFNAFWRASLPSDICQSRVDWLSGFRPRVVDPSAFDEERPPGMLGRVSKAREAPSSVSRSVPRAHRD